MHKAPVDKRARGDHYESLASAYLQRQGLEFICQGFHCRWGEIDLVFRDSASLVFVEVRFRGAKSFVSGAISVDYRKQQKLCRTARMYLAKHSRGDVAARFDIVSIAESVAGSPEIKWIKNAFECEHQ